MTPELRKIVAKFKNDELSILTETRALNCALVHINGILNIQIFWVEKGTPTEAQFGAESTQEYWEALKKEIIAIQLKTSIHEKEDCNRGYYIKNGYNIKTNR